MKRFLLVLFAISLMNLAQGEDETLDEDDIGPFLIYNCSKKHWSCVSEGKNEECIKARSDDLKKKNTYNHSCASIEKLPSKKGCFQKQLFYSTKNHGTRFCVKDEWKEKADLSNL